MLLPVNLNQRRFMFRHRLMLQRARQGKTGQKPRQRQQKRGRPPAIQKGTGHAAQREGQHDGGMQPQALARTGPPDRVNRMEKVDL
nr:hypothetical protein [Acetobacter lovaniensis]